MDTLQIISAFNTTSATDLGKDIILVAKEMPNLLDRISEQIVAGNIVGALNNIRGAAGEIKAMKRVNTFYHCGDDMA